MNEARPVWLLFGGNIGSIPGTSNLPRASTSNGCIPVFWTKYGMEMP